MQPLTDLTLTTNQTQAQARREKIQMDAFLMFIDLDEPIEELDPEDCQAPDWRDEQGI